MGPPRRPHVPFLGGSGLNSAALSAASPRRGGSYVGRRWHVQLLRVHERCPPSSRPGLVSNLRARTVSLSIWLQKRRRKIWEVRDSAHSCGATRRRQSSSPSAPISWASWPPRWLWGCLLLLVSSDPSVSSGTNNKVRRRVRRLGDLAVASLKTLLSP